MDDIYTLSLLLDFYGSLLTPHQNTILDMHCNSDYSLSEIAEHLNISRQGVYDNVKRAKASLYKMEQKLGLVGKFLAQKNKARDILEFLDAISIEGLGQTDKNNLSQVRERILDIINGF